MSLSDLASIGSFVSGLAVVTTLLFLLLQMRQTNRNQKALMQQGRSARVVDLILRRTEPNVSEAISRAWLADMTLDASQVGAINDWVGALFWSIEDSFMQYQAGLLHATSWEVDLASLRAFLSFPYCRVSWKINRQFSGGEYRDFVDSMMKEIKVAKPFDELATWKTLMAEELAEAAYAKSACPPHHSPDSLPTVGLIHGENNHVTFRFGSIGIVHQRASRALFLCVPGASDTPERTESTSNDPQ